MTTHKRISQPTNTHLRTLPSSAVSRKSNAPRSSAANALQKRVGNHGIQRLLGGKADQSAGGARTPAVQPKLTVSKPGDIHEREADRIADLVMRVPDSSLPEKPAVHSGLTARVQRTCDGCNDELEKKPGATIQRKEEGGPPSVTQDVAKNIDSLRGGGSELPAPTRAFFEPRFGADFSQVRLHTDARAADTAKSINAKAFTVGRDIAFGAGQYAPESPEGQRLLAHELTHVVQQDGDHIQRAWTQAKEGAATGGSASEWEKGPANFLSKTPGTSSDLSSPSRMPTSSVSPRGGVQLTGGIDQPGDRYEQSADAVVVGEFAGPLLDQFASRTAASSVQRKPNDGTTTLTKGGPSVARSPRTAPDPASGTKGKQTGKSMLAKPPIEWAGVGEAGKVFQTSSHENFVDLAWKETVEVSTDWTMAEFKSHELGTDAVLEVSRTIKMRDAHNQSILIRSRGRTFFFADKLPNDVHAAVYAPAKSIKHDGVIQITSGDTIKAMQTMDHKLAGSGSLAEMLNSEPMVGFDVPPKDRLAQFGKFTRGTLPGYERNLSLIESIAVNAPRARAEVQEYIKQKLDYRTPNGDLLRSADLVITSIRELRTYSWTGYETSDLYYWLDQVSDKLAGLVSYARTVKPKEKDGWDHALDLVKAVGKAIYGLGVAVKELGAMARDATMKGLDKIANVFGYEIEWKAWSGVGKAYEQGKSTKEIFTAVANGFVDQWKDAFDRASNGDYSGLMDLGAELALDIALEVITVGAATPAVAAKRIGTVARMASFTVDAAATLRKRTDDLLKAGKNLIEKVPATARRKFEDLMDSMEGFGYALKHEVVPIGAGRVALDVNTIPQAIARVKGERAMKAAGRAIDKLSGGTKKIGKSVLQKLDDLQAKMPDAVHSLAARVAKPGGDKLIKALDRALPSIKKLDDDVAAAALRHAADAVDPVAYLDNVTWVMKHDGIKVAARKELVRQAVMREKPLDLTWLRNTELDNITLEFLAMDPATNWTTFMKVSSKPSDYFPASLRKKLKKSAYVDAGAKLRGVAGELSFVVNTKNLPAGFKIVARQVPAGGKVIDFKLLDAAGNPAILEVKSWNAQRWTKEIDANLGQPKGKLSGGTKSMIGQLQAAKAVPAGKSKKMTVYLAVSDVIKEADLVRLAGLLKRHGLGDVVIHRFPEASLKATRDKLRDAMGLPVAGAAATALVTADTVADYAEGPDE
jgi:hypothetical protein